MNELLHRYVADRSEPAFTELVRQHLDLVYSAALRQVNGDVPAAQDVTQAVFTDLARKASRLVRHTSLTGWLYTSTRYLAAKARRAEQRRRVREQGAYAMNQILQAHDSAPAWHELRPLLDDVMHELNAADREAVLMRYFERLPLAEVGGRLGLSENTARMRVERALDKLRAAFARRGVTSTLAALTALLAEKAVAAAPAGLAVQIGHASFAAAAAGAGWGVSWLDFAGSLKAKLLVVAGATAIVAGWLILPQQWKASRRPTPPSAQANAQANADAAQAAGPLTTAPAPAADDAAATTNKLVLHLVADDSGKPVPSVPVDYLLMEGTNRSQAHLWATRFGVCNVPVRRDTASNLFLWTKTDGFGDTWLNWRKDRGDQIPREYTVRLARAVQIGGLVLDADGRPVSEAYVGFSTPSGLADTESARPEAHASTGIGATTGADGRWSLSRIAPEVFHRSDGEASHPEHASSPRVSIAANPKVEKQLRAGTYVFRLGRAVTAQGVIVDAEGQPVAEAKLAVAHEFGRTAAADIGSTPIRHGTNAADGTFAVPGCVPGQIRLSVEAAGFVGTELEADLETNSPPLRVTLEHGHLLKLRVVDKQGHAVPGAEVEFRLLTGREIPPTDGEGRIAWDRAPAGELVFDVRADGFMRASNLKLKADGEEHLVTLSTGLTLSGAVRDAATGKPITRFRLIPSLPRLRLAATDPSWQPAESSPWISSPDGTFRQAIGEAGSPNTSMVFKFEAEGYAPVVTRAIQADEGEARLDIAMWAGASITITVLLPDGRPAAGADIGLVSPGAQLRLRPGGLDQGNKYPRGNGVPQADDHGRFVVPSDDALTGIIAAAPAGYAEADLPSLGSNPTLQLQPWGRIEGTFLSGGHGAPNRSVRFEYGAARPNTVSADLWAYEVKTSDDGRFVFPQVPPGKHNLVQMIPPPLASVGSGRSLGRPIVLTEVEVRPGETTTVTVGTSAYTISARLRWPADFKPDPSWSPAISLQAARPRSAATTQADPQTAAAPRPRPSLRLIPFLSNPDGTWVADNVPPGEYVVSVRVTTRGELGTGLKPRASARVLLVVPSDPPTGTLDLGEILLQPTPSAPVAKPPSGSL